MLNLVRTFDLILEKLSRWGIVALLLVILTLAVSSIVLRWMGQSPLWIEPLVRHLVFFSAFLGGSLATSKKVHIKIDILTHVLEKSSSKILHWLHTNIISLFCLVTVVILVKASYDFYLVEKEFGTHAFLDLHSSVLVAIVPVGLGLIALRFLNRLIISLFNGESV